MFYTEISKINIFSISKNNILEEFNIRNPSNLTYIEINPETFQDLLSSKNKLQLFLEFNKDSLYILREGSFLDIKNLILDIEDNSVSIGISKSQKAHILSPLEMRLNIYILSMFDFKYSEIFKLNDFNNLPKNRYLPSNKTYFK